VSSVRAVSARGAFPRAAPDVDLDETHGVRIARIEHEQLAAAAELHEQMAAVQFVAGGGRTFLRRYYLAWSRTSSGLALAATDDAGRLTGVLLGSLDPARHYQDLLRRDGAALAVRLIARGMADPMFGRDLVVTRLRRYSRGLTRAVVTPVRGCRRPSLAAGSSEAIGEIALLLVHPQRRGSGIGRALMDAAIQEAHEAGLAALTLVTPPDYAARGFYEHLGWRLSGSLTSRSGEPYLLYRWQLTVNADDCVTPVDPAVVAAG
jgi:GNAT superfamily N-acetyltransferase